MKKIELFTSVIPSKLFECMAMGIPVLHGVLGESAEIVEKNQVGLTFEPENEQQLYELLINLKDDTNLYQNIQKQALKASKKFDRSVLAAEYLTLICQLK